MCKYTFMYIVHKAYNIHTLHNNYCQLLIVESNIRAVHLFLRERERERESLAVTEDQKHVSMYTLQKLNGCFDLAVVILVAVLSDTQRLCTCVCPQ